MCLIWYLISKPQQSYPSQTHYAEDFYSTDPNNRDCWADVYQPVKSPCKDLFLFQIGLDSVPTAKLPIFWVTCTSVKWLVGFASE